MEDRVPGGHLVGIGPAYQPQKDVARAPTRRRLLAGLLGALFAVPIAGVLWVLHTDASWRALPSGFGPWPTVYSRYRQWRLSGLWPRLFQALHDTTTTAP